MTATARNTTSDRWHWGRWGEEDERGAANLLTPSRVKDAAALVQTGEVISLAVALGRATPVPSHRPAPAHFMWRDGGDYGAGPRAAARTRFSDDSVLLPTHVGTHVDALAHVWRGDRLYNGFSQHVIDSADGATRCGIDKLGPMVGRGVLLDLAADSEALRDGSEISADALERCAASQQTAIHEGDMVVLRTGWWTARASQPGQDFSGEPGPGVDAATWLVEQGVSLVGADNFAFEALPSSGPGRFPVHELLLRDCGIPIVEGLALDALAERRRHQFLLVVAPLPISGGTASPVTPVAVL